MLHLDYISYGQVHSKSDFSFQNFSTWNCFINKLGLVQTKFTYKALNTGQIFYEVMEKRGQWMQQLVSFKTSEKWDLLWSKKSKIITKELLEKFHLISFTPKLDNCLDPDFIWWAIVSMLKNHEISAEDEIGENFIDRFHIEAYSYPK